MRKRQPGARWNPIGRRGSARRQNWPGPRPLELAVALGAGDHAGGNSFFRATRRERRLSRYAVFIDFRPAVGIGAFMSVEDEIMSELSLKQPVGVMQTRECAGKKDLGKGKLLGRVESWLHSSE